MIEFNYQNEVVSSPTVIVSGRTNAAKQGLVQFVNNSNRVFPPQFFEVNNGQFKALLHVSPNEPNNFEVHILDRAHLNNRGFPEDHKRVVDKSSLTLSHYPLPDNKPVHLCVILGHDSSGLYDMPKYKLQRGEVANLDTAIQRLKVAGRMMQAFTQDEFHNRGLSNRLFQFVEESTNSQRVFGYDVQSQEPHNEVKIHVFRSPLSVQELRNPDYAQQNPTAKDNGFLFNHAIHLVQHSDLMKHYCENSTPIQCAVMYLDSTWNGQYITTHAALGGGTGDVKMAIFGSHGLHLYPYTFPEVSAAFADETHLSKDEVANDANQCGTTWECLNICLGAFMHEIGHLFGSPHQVDGVMLRDYIWWNRQFMTRELKCLRDGNPGSVIGDDGRFPKHCNWNVMDIMRYLYHGSFAIPTDNDDASFRKTNNSLLHKKQDYPVPNLYINSPGQVIVRSESGIFMVELCGDSLARHHIPFYPKSYGGTGLQHELFLDFEELLGHFKRSWRDNANDFDIRILSTSGDLWLPGFRKHCYPSAESVIRSDFNLGRGEIDGYKSNLLGQGRGDMKFVGFDVNRVNKVRIYHGSSLDGMTFYFSGLDKAGPPPVPKRNYLNKLKDLTLGNDLQSAGVDSGVKGEVTIGNIKLHYTDFKLEPGEKIVSFAFRNGAWIDAVEIETSRGRKSGMLGNANGGHLSKAEPPTTHHTMIGLYGYTGRWMDGVGLIYAQL